MPKEWERRSQRMEWVLPCWIINFMPVTQHYITASVFVIFLWHSALVVIVTVIDCGNGDK